MSEYNVHLQEIIKMIDKIENALAGKTFEDFVHDNNLSDASLMRIHFIGETMRSIPYSLKKKYKHVKWRKFSRLRNIIGHRYANINQNIIWDVIQNLPELKNQCKEILEKETLDKDNKSPVLRK